MNIKATHVFVLASVSAAVVLICELPGLHRMPGAFSSPLSKIVGSPLSGKSNGGPSQVNAIRFSSDGQRLLIAGPSQNNSGAKDNRLRVWDVSSGSEICRLSAETMTQYDVGRTLLLPDFKTMITTWGDGHVDPVDIHSGQAHKSIDVMSGAISSLALSPDEKILAIGATRIVEFRDARSYSLLRTYEHGDQNTMVQFGPDSKTVVCLWESSRPQTLDIATARQIHCPRWVYRVQKADAFTFSNGGKFLAKATGKTIEIWTTPTTNGGIKLSTFTTSLLTIGCLQFSPDGKVLAVGGKSETDRPVELIRLSDALEPV